MQLIALMPNLPVVPAGFYGIYPALKVTLGVKLSGTELSLTNKSQIVITNYIQNQADVAQW